MSRLTRLIEEMIAFDPDPDRTGHMLKVYGFTKIIAADQDLDEGALETLEAAAVVHDVGIRPALEKYGSSTGPNQEKEGPKPAREMAERCGYSRPQAERIAWLVGHHHTWQGDMAVDHQVLMEADLLVNLHEHGIAAWDPATAARFKTRAGSRIYAELYPRKS